MKKPGLSLSILRVRDFRFLLFTRMFSLAALQAQAVIIGWQIYSLTHDPLLLGLTGLAEAVPAITCALFAGHIVDNSRPQRVYLYCLAGLTANTFGLFMVGGGLIALSSHAFLVCAYLGIFISGFSRSFIMPASFSLLAQIAPRENISSASAWMSTGFQAASIVSPALAGLMFGAYGPLAAWLMPMSMMGTAFLLMSFIKPEPRREPLESREPFVRSVREGWKFILSRPVLLGAMALDMLAVLFGGAVALLPAFATDILHTGSTGLGLLRGAPAAGAVFMALLLAVRPMQQVHVRHLLWVVVGFGISMIGFGLSHVFWFSIICLIMSGVFDSVSMVIRQTIMQLLTPDHMRGRVSSVNSMFIVSSNELGAFESGLLGKLLGIMPAVVLGGLGTLLVAAGAALASPEMRRTVISPDQALPPAPQDPPELAMPPA